MNLLLSVSSQRKSTSKYGVLRLCTKITCCCYVSKEMLECLMLSFVLKYAWTSSQMHQSRHLGTGLLHFAMHNASVLNKNIVYTN